MKNKPIGKDFLLLFLYLPGKTNQLNEKVDGMTRLTKAMFLLEKEIKKSLKDADKIKIYPDFFAWNFGPWSKQVMDDLEFFQNIKFIECVDSSSSENIYTEEVEDFQKFNNLDPDNSDNNGYEQKGFHLTKVGEKYVKERILDNFSDNEQKILIEFKKRINSLSLYAILEYVYTKYDKFTDKSEIKDKILKN
jgi:phage anti-repressor protein